MPHYESENLRNLIDKIKRQQEAIQKSTGAAPQPQQKPTSPDKPKTWEEMELERQKKTAK